MLHSFIFRYLTLKFEEMEAKMQKERKGKTKDEEVNTDNTKTVLTETTSNSKETLDTIENVDRK